LHYTIHCCVWGGIEPTTRLSVQTTYTYRRLLVLRTTDDDSTWHQCMTYWLIRLALNDLWCLVIRVHSV